MNLNQKYVISFSALVALYKAGYPADKIGEAGGSIMESALVQANSDVAEVIKEYNRNTVASLGVIDGKLFINQVDEAGKDYWLKEAGGFKKYCEDIPSRVIRICQGNFLEDLIARDYSEFVIMML